MHDNTGDDKNTWLQNRSNLQQIRFVFHTSSNVFNITVKLRVVVCLGRHSNLMRALRSTVKIAFFNFKLFVCLWKYLIFAVEQKAWHSVCYFIMVSTIFVKELLPSTIIMLALAVKNMVCGSYKDDKMASNNIPDIPYKFQLLYIIVKKKQ